MSKFDVFGTQFLKVKDSLFTGIKEIYYHKMRSFLTLLGIMLGVASLISMMSIMNGFKQSFVEHMNAYGGLARASIYPVNQEQIEYAGTMHKTKGLTIDDMSVLLKEHSDIIDVICPQLSRGRNDVSRKGNSLRMWNWSVVGTTADFAEINQLEIAEGRTIAPFDDASISRVCVIGSIIQAELFESYQSPLNESIKVNGIDFTIVGTFKHKVVEPADVMSKRSKEEKEKAKKVNDMLSSERIKLPKRAIDLEDGKAKRPLRGRQLWEKYGKDNSLWHKNLIVVIPFSTFQVLFKGDDKVDSYEIRFKDSKDLPAYMNAIKETLKKERNGVEDFQVKAWAENFEATNKQIATLNIVFGAIAIIALLVGGIGIMNVILASISERIREIGVRKSVGARNVDIFLQFLIETIVLSLIGGLLGILLGILFTEIISSYAGMKTVVLPSSILLALASSSFIGLLFGIYPSFKAAGLNPINALRYE